MFGKILDLLDKPYKDEIYHYLMKHSKFSRTKEWLGLAVLFTIAMIIINVLFFMKNYEYDPPAIRQVSSKTLQNGEYKTQLVSLGDPRVTHQALQQWTIRAVNNMYSFDFNRFDQQLAASKRYFTPSAYKAYVTSIENLKLKETIVDNKQLVSMTAIDTPQILTEITRDGKRFWQIEVPVVITTTSGTSVYEYYTLNLIIALESSNENPSGLYIYEMETSTTNSM